MTAAAKRSPRGERPRSEWAAVILAAAVLAACVLFVLASLACCAAKDAAARLCRCVRRK